MALTIGNPSDSGGPAAAGAGEIAYLDTVTDGYIAESASVVASAVLTLNTLRSEALPRKASRDLIMKRAEDFGSD
jgi:hypothetical protein